MAKRKYLFYTRSLSGGGAEPVWSHLASLFAEAGNEVVLALDQKGEPATPPSDKVSIEIVGTQPHAGVLHLSRLIRRFRPDVALSAIAGNTLKLALASLLAGRRTPLVFSIHGTLEHRSGLLSAAAMRGLPLLGRTARRIVCVSDGVRRTMIEDWGADPRKTVTIYNPVPAQEPVVNQAALAARPPRIAALGRLSSEKGFDVLIDAFAELRTAAATLEIAGTGPEAARLQAQIAARGLADRIALLGFVDPASLYRTARLVVIPSRSEAFSLVTVEALSAGLPVIATDCDGPREILDGGRYGRIVTINDPHALATAIDAVLAEPGDPAPRIERARAFSVDASFHAWSALLDAILSERRSG